MSRKFYKSIVQIEVLSEDWPVGKLCGPDLKTITWAIKEGTLFGKTKILTETELSGKEMADALRNQGADPAEFMLNDNGEDD